MFIDIISFLLMNTIKSLIAFFVVCFFHSTVCAQTFVEMKQIYPVSINAGQRVIEGFQPFNSFNDEQIFANAMKWSINNFCKEGRKELFDVSVNKKLFSINMALDYNENGKTKYEFNCKANIKVIDSKIVYTIYDVQYKTNSLVPFSNMNHLDKLNPEKKSKHKEIITIFQELASTQLNQLFDAVVSDFCAPITHWNDINIQRPVKGMIEDECYLAFGKPNNSYEDNNGRIQWSYGLNFVLIFKEGKLETIIR